MIYPAHIRCTKESCQIQSVQQHCKNTALLATEFLKALSLDKAGYLAGLLHDMGKFTHSFKEYIQSSIQENTISRGKVIHTHATTRFFIENFYDQSDTTAFEKMTAVILAYASGAHHGLFDSVDKERRSGFSHRLNWDNALYQQSKKQFLLHCIDAEDLKHLFQQANQQMEVIYNQILNLPPRNNNELFFHLGLFTRLILSSVIHADRTDTAIFMNGLSTLQTVQSDSVLWTNLLKTTENKLNSLPSATAIDKVRGQISKQCKDAADLPDGIYRLNLPTGGGKTLSSLRYALAHSAKYNKSRIIFVSPLLSILEQNAQVIRDFIQNDSIILEHHSNIVQEKGSSTELDPHELMAESWDSPIIITTLVQLLDTIFSGKTSHIRRFQALCNSLLVIDEVQTVPTKMLTLFNLAIQFLSKICNTTIILCSATQPCLEKAKHPLQNIQSLIQLDPNIWKIFQRTQIIDVGSRRCQQIPDFITKIIQKHNSVLVICNKKEQARFFYTKMKELSSLSCFHLSTAMCVQHRRDTLVQIYQALQNSKNTKVVCISTQLIEAGVDISFECVIRLTAGMDSIIQSAGRCNRNGEQSNLAPVYLLNCSDEKLEHLSEIQTCKSATLSLLSAFKNAPQSFDNTLSSQSAIDYYYNHLYTNMTEQAQDYPLTIDSKRTSLFRLLSLNETYADELFQDTNYGLNQAFSTAGKHFSVFDDQTIDILVPYQQGDEIIAEISSLSNKYSIKEMKGLLNKAKPFTISIYQYQKTKLENLGGLTALLNGSILVLDPSFYDAKIGLTSTQSHLDYLEV